MVAPAASPLPQQPVLEHPAAHRGPGPDWAAMRRVLVVRPDNVGDVLMAGPALRALDAALGPGAEVDLLASPAGAAAAALLPWVSATVVASVSWQQLPGGPVSADDDPDAALVADLAARSYDAAVVLTSFSQSPWPAAAVLRRAGVPVRVGTSKEFGGELLTHWVPAPPDEGHQVDRALALLERVGVPPAGSGLEARVPAAGVERVDALLAGVDEPVVVVAPGASCPSRRYSPERLAAVGRALASHGCRVVVTGTAKEADLVAAAADGVPGVLRLAGELDLGGLAALVDRAALVVTGNSGGAHLADALGTPVVVLFAGTETPGQYRPRTAPSAVLGREVSCSPCRQLVCPFEHECLDVPAEEVVAVSLRLMCALSGAIAPESAHMGRSPTGHPRP